MFDWLSKKRKETKRKEQREQELRASLSEKLSQYEQNRDIEQTDAGDNDHTVMVLNGRRLRVAKSEISITDIDE